jgi:hypothetical protein
MLALRRRTRSTVLVLTLLSWTSVAEAACLSPKEREAEEVYALRTTAMVGAQSCNMLDRYNAFATRFNSALTYEGRALKGYFIKTYGRGSEHALDQFTTRLYNETVVRGSAGDHFCSETAVLFDILMDLAVDKLAPFAQDRSREALPVNEVCASSRP